MKLLKKILLVIPIILFTTNVYANKINYIDIDIEVDSLGDAHVTENISFTSNKDTEIYHTYNNLGPQSITNFSVSDSTGANYTYDSDWDIDASFKEKTYKYGYNYLDNGVDLCLGISHYGTYVYKLNYTIKGFVVSLNDYDAIYENILDFDMDIGRYDIKIHTSKSFNDVDVWGFGKRGALAYVNEGIIYLSSDGQKLDDDEYVVVLAKLDKGLFESANHLDMSFDELLDLAKEGSSPYEEKEPIWAIILSFLMSFLPFVLIAYFASKAGEKYAFDKKMPPKDVNMFRDIPCNKNIFYAYTVATAYELMKNKTDFLGSLLLKWEKDKNIVIETSEEGILKKHNTVIRFNEKPNNSVKESELWDMFVEASKDGILEQKEFEKYATKHADKILKWFDDLRLEGINDLKAKSLILQKYKENGTPKKGLHAFYASDELNEEAEHLAGLKKFFKEFKNMEDKRSVEVHMWDEYLIYAQMFGVAKEVAKEMKNVYPEYFTSENDNNSLSHNLYTLSMIDNFSSSVISNARAAAQNYSGGGGGFSAGGGGGGSFGGGGGGSR